MIKKLIIFGLLVITISSSVVFLQPKDAAACVPTYLTHCNAEELRAYNECAYGGTGWHEGAIWFSNSSNYFNLGVSVGADAQFVNVKIRGSVYSCQQPSWDTINAADVTSQSSRLSGLSSTNLNRGTFQGAAYQWTTQGGEISATLDVRGLAMNNVGQAGSQQIGIGLYRCYQTSGYNCATTNIPVTVTRERRIDYQLMPTASVSQATTEGSINNLTVRGVVNNTGSTASESNAVQWVYTRFVKTPTGSRKTGVEQNSTAPTTHFAGSTQLWAGRPGSFPRGTTQVVNAGNQQIGTFDVGTEICYTLSVQPFQHNNGQWRHSAPACVVIAKKPKVQILGADLFTGRGAVGRPAATSKVATAQTKANAQVQTVPAPANAFQGLWRTGVNDSNQKLGSNAYDEHWVLDRVVRPSGRGGATCQWASTGPTGSGALVQIPNTSSSTTIKPRVIGESPGWVGTYMASDTAIVGNAVKPIVRELERNNEKVWQISTGKAAWIGINRYGQNYSANGCLDPTFAENPDINDANILVYKLKNGFTIDPAANVDLDTVRLKLTGAVDNRFKFVVNGTELGNWQSVDWHVPGSNATSENRANVFRNGSNSVEVHVQSTYTHTGLLIEDLSVVGATARVEEGKVYGSWAEYAIAPSGLVKDMASGSGYSGGTTVDALCSLSYLTFSNRRGNSCNDAAIGNYRHAAVMPDIASRFPVTTSTPRFASGSNLNNAAGLYTVASDVTIAGGSIPKGRSVIINAPNNTVTISGNINYTNGVLNSLSDIPQVVIIARNIVITGGVTNVDSWLIATGVGTEGRISTCGDVNQPTQLRSGNCSNVLTVNGPISANHLLMYRTAGAGKGAAAGDPAEIFNLRPDAYLWAANYGASSGKLPTINVKELPPRF